jgi:heme O synthase-like polyprenyltransferase
MPHFLAINWMYRDEYRKGGFVMWANDDDTGMKTATLCMVFSVLALLVSVMPVLCGLVGLWFLPPVLALNGLLLFLAVRFFGRRDRLSARKLFLFTLLYLPGMLALTVLFWRRGA